MSWLLSETPCPVSYTHLEDGQKFALAKLKKLTGGGFITARGLMDKQMTSWLQTHLPICLLYTSVPHVHFIGAPLLLVIHLARQPHPRLRGYPIGTKDPLADFYRYLSGIILKYILVFAEAFQNIPFQLSLIHIWLCRVNRNTVLSNRKKYLQRIRTAALMACGVRCGRSGIA